MADTGPITARVQFRQNDVRGTPLDGGWWPRSTDPVAEIPSLIAAIESMYGSIRSMALGAHGWDSRPKRLVIGGRRIRIGFFESQTPALLTALIDNGRVDLLVVPPATDVDVAEKAMAVALDPASRLSAAQILEMSIDGAVRRVPAARPAPALAPAAD